MIDLPPVPWPVALAVVGWGVAVLGLTWRASARLVEIESRLAHVETEAGRHASAGDRLARIETRLDGQERTLERIEAKLDAR